MSDPVIIAPTSPTVRLPKPVRQMPDPAFKQRMAYVRAIRRGSRKHTSPEAFRATIEEAKRAVRPAKAVEKK